MLNNIFKFFLETPSCQLQNSSCTVAGIAQVHLVIVNIVTVIKSLLSAEQLPQLSGQDNHVIKLRSPGRY